MQHAWSVIWRKRKKATTNVLSAQHRQMSLVVWERTVCVHHGTGFLLFSIKNDRGRMCQLVWLLPQWVPLNFDLT